MNTGTLSVKKFFGRGRRHLVPLFETVCISSLFQDNLTEESSLSMSDKDKMMKTGWWYWPFVKSADFSEDILVELPWDDELGLYESKHKAKAAAEEFFVEQRQQAILDIAFLDKPYVSPGGYVYICPDHLVDQWRQEAHDQLRMAEAILRRLVTAA